MIFCFNELSLFSLITEIKTNTAQVTEMMSIFLLILKTAKTTEIPGSRVELRTEKGIWGTSLSNAETLGEWVKNHMERDQLRLLMSIQDHSPYIEAENNSPIYNYKGQEAQGFSAALYLDCPAISFSYSNGEEENKIVKLDPINREKSKTIFNFTKKDQFSAYQEFYSSFAHCQNYIGCLNDLKSKAKEKKLWSNLVFPDDFDSLELEPVYILKLAETLCLLNTCIQTLKRGKSVLQNIKKVLPDARDESATVKGDKHKIQERTKLFEGKSVPCLWHTNLDSSMRLYFKVGKEKHLIYIGYIGKHLGTKKYKKN